MAHGFLCKHCGHQETPHFNFSLVEEDPNLLQSGCQYPLSSCPGFEYTEVDIPAVVEAEKADLATGGSHEGCH